MVLGMYVLDVCIPCVGKMETIYKIKKLTHCFFSHNSFILVSLEIFMVFTIHFLCAKG